GSARHGAGVDRAEAEQWSSAMKKARPGEPERATILLASAKWSWLRRYTVTAGARSSVIHDCLYARGKCGDSIRQADDAVIHAVQPRERGGLEFLARYCSLGLLCLD